MLLPQAAADYGLAQKHSHWGRSATFCGRLRHSILGFGEGLMTVRVNLSRSLERPTLMYRGDERECLGRQSDIERQGAESVAIALYTCRRWAFDLNAPAGHQQYMGVIGQSPEQQR